MPARSILLTLKKYNCLIIASVFSAIGLYLRYSSFAGRDLIGDDLFSLEIAHGPLPHFWERSSIGELMSFPGHYLSLWLSGQVFGASKWGLALPHMIASVFGFYVLYLICRRYFKTSLAYLVSFAVVCFNNQLIFYAFELRFYGVLSVLALACFYLSEKIIKDGESLSFRKKLAIGNFFILTTLYHLYGLLIVGTCLLFSILDESGFKTIKRVWLDTYKFLLPFAFVAVPLFLWYAAGNPDLKSSIMEKNIATFQFIPNPLLDLSGFLKGIFGNLIGDKKLYFLLAGLFAAFLLPHKDRFRQIGFFLILIVLPVQLILLSDLWGNYWFIQRQFLWTAPLFAVLLGWCWDRLAVKVLRLPDGES